MATTASATIDRPANVPADLAFDFDMYRVLDGSGDDPHAGWKRVQDEFPPIFWTPAHGGHWVATRGEDIRQIQEDHARFSSRDVLIPRGTVPLLIPLMLDPPRHTPIRRIIMPAFMPKMVATIDKRARNYAVELIEAFRSRGECEFVGDFAGAMPIITFLSMLDLPSSDAPMLREWVSWSAPLTNERAAEGWSNLETYVLEWIARRRAAPGDDLISQIVTTSVDGVPLSDNEVQSLCLQVLGGGLDTVVSMTSFIAQYLAGDSDLRTRLRKNPGDIPKAIEEFVRRFGITNLSRNVREDMDYNGISFRKDDVILLPYPLIGLDERLNEFPMVVDIDRRRGRHGNFGNGPHTCPGAVLARREMSIFIEEWLPRIPDFWVKPGTVLVVTTGTANNFGELWLQWAVE